MPDNTNWYDAYSGPVKVPSPQQYNGGSDVMGINFFNMAGMSTANQLGSGGYNMTGMDGIIGMFMNMMGANRPFLPTAGNFSPVAHGIAVGQQQEMMRAAGYMNATDVDHFAASIARINRGGAGTPLVVDAAAIKESEVLVGALNHPQLRMLMQQSPEIGRIVDSFTGGTFAGAAMNLYSQTRGIDMNASDVASVTAQMASRYMISDPASPNFGLANRAFTQGLTKNEVGDVMGIMARNNILDPRQGTMGADPQQYFEGLQKANALTGSLRDIFGPNAPVSELINNLQKMTQGGLNQVSLGELQNLVDTMKLTAVKAGVSMEGMNAVVQQGAIFAKQMGMSGITGAHLATQAMGYGSAAAGAQPYEDRWGKSTGNELANDILQQTMAFSGSNVGLGMAGIVRLASETNAAPGSELGVLAAKIKSGSLSSAEIKQFEDLDGIAQRFTGKNGFANVGAGVDFLRSSQNEAFMRDVKMLPVLRDLDVGALSDSMGGSSTLMGIMGGKLNEGMSRGLVDTILGVRGGKEQDKVAAVAAFLKKNGAKLDGNDDALIKAKMVLGDFRDINKERGIGQFEENSMVDAVEANAKRETQLAERLEKEKMWKAAGIGTGGALGQRLMDIFTGEGSVSTSDTIGAFLGMPSAEVERMLQAGTATGLTGKAKAISEVRDGLLRGKGKLDIYSLSEETQGVISKQFGGMHNVAGKQQDILGALVGGMSEDILGDDQLRSLAMHDEMKGVRRVLGGMLAENDEWASDSGGQVHRELSVMMSSLRSGTPLAAQLRAQYIASSGAGTDKAKIKAAGDEYDSVIKSLGALEGKGSSMTNADVRGVVSTEAFKKLGKMFSHEEDGKVVFDQAGRALESKSFRAGNSNSQFQNAKFNNVTFNLAPASIPAAAVAPPPPPPPAGLTTPKKTGVTP